jgi:hypothetical protein
MGTILCIVSLYLMTAAPTYAALLLYDDMSVYSAGSNLEGQGSWTKGGSGPSCTVQNATPLAYAGYEGGGSNYVQMPSASSTASRIYRGFTEVAMPGNTVYVAFLLRLSSATATGDYFISLGNSGTGTTYTPRLFAKSSGAGYQLGIGKAVTVGSAAWDNAVYSFGTTYLVVIRLDGITGTTNDALYLWVNPNLDSEPSTASAGATTTSDGDPSALGNFHWHNRSTSNPSGTFDAVRVAAAAASATAWTDLGAKFSTPTITVQGGTLAFGNMSVGNISPEQSYTVSGDNLTGNITVTVPAGFEVSTTSGSGFDTSLNLAHTDGSVSETTIYTRFAPSVAQNYSTNITHASSGATTETKSVTGNGVLSPPSDLHTSETNVNNFASSWDAVTGADGYRLDVASRSEFLPAGSTLITNDFEGSWPPAGWITNAADQSGTYELSGTNSVRLNAADDYLITPLITRSSEFRAWSYRTSETPVLNVEQSASTNGPWAEVSGSPFGGATQQWNQCSAVLGNSAGVYLRCRRTGTGNVYLDDVHIVSTQTDFVPGYDNRPVAGGATTLLSVTGLVSHTEYFYRVRATNDNSTSANSGVQGVTTRVMPAPTIQPASNIQSGGFDANWQAVPEAEGYYLDVSTNNAFGNFQAGYDNRDVGNVTTHTVTGLTAAVTNYYRVRAYDSGSTSASSGTESLLTTIKPEPTYHATDFNAPTVTHRTIILDWNDASGGIIPDGYLVRGSTNGFADIPTPTDTVNVFNSTNWPTGYANKIDQGVQSDELRGLAAQRTYYFKLFPYANQFSQINYKTDGSVPQFSVTTGVAPLEDFEGTNQLSYTTNSLPLGSGNWLFENALLGTTASDKRQDQKSARIQGNGLIEMQFDVTDVEKFSLEYANSGTTAGGTFEVGISTNAGASWNQLNGEVTCEAALKTATTTIHRLGPTRFRIRMTGGTRINIDNIRLTPYEHPRTLIRIR